MNRPLLINSCKPKFDLGSVRLTQSVARLYKAGKLNPFYYLARHVQCDWGGVGSDDQLANDVALVSGGRLLSTFDAPQGCIEQRLLVITESDRSVTTLLFPSEY